MRLGRVALTLTPRHLLHQDPAIAALDTPHLIQEENQNPPEGDELETPGRKTIIAGGRLMGSRADRHRPNPRLELYVDTPLVGGEAGAAVNEATVTVTVV